MLSYVGGKSKIGKWIVPFYPKDMECYVETFSGMYWCFFNMNLGEYPNLKKIVYNDFNPLNYNLFSCVKDHQRLLTECEKIYVQEKGVIPTNPICKQNFEQFQKEIVINPIDCIVLSLYDQIQDSKNKQIMNRKLRKIHNIVKVNTAESGNYESVKERYMLGRIMSIVFRYQTNLIN